MSLPHCILQEVKMKKLELEIGKHQTKQEKSWLFWPKTSLRTNIRGKKNFAIKVNEVKDNST